jgi:hypothetical protein
MPSAQAIRIERPISRAPIQRPLRILGYHSDTRAWGTEARRNPEESIMSPADSSTAVVAADSNSETASQATRKRARPMTSGQEAVFFGITFAVAVVFQLAVILKVANVIAW